MTGPRPRTRQPANNSSDMGLAPIAAAGLPVASRPESLERAEPAVRKEEAAKSDDSQKKALETALQDGSIVHPKIRIKIRDSQVPELSAVGEETGKRPRHHQGKHTVRISKGSETD